MGLREKYTLYNMLYMKAGSRVLARGQHHMIMPWHIHKMVMERLNFILAAIGEKFTEEEYFECNIHEVSVEEE